MYFVGGLKLFIGELYTLYIMYCITKHIKSIGLGLILGICLDTNMPRVRIKLYG